MKVYLDVSCLNRPFDDQGQKRVRGESEAVLWILRRCAAGNWELVSSSIAVDEIEAMPNQDRMKRVRVLLESASVIIELAADDYERATEIARLGIKPADALHVAAAEKLGAEVLASCDDKLCRVAQRQESRLRVRVVNPVTWLKEIGDVPDA